MLLSMASPSAWATVSSSFREALASLKEVREARLNSVISFEMFSGDFAKLATTALTMSVVVHTARSPKASHAPQRAAASIPPTPQSSPEPTAIAAAAEPEGLGDFWPGGAAGSKLFPLRKLLRA